MNCGLCGLESGSAEFCCAGCENVHAILVESGVIGSGQDFRETEVYRESLRLGLIARGTGVGNNRRVAETQRKGKAKSNRDSAEGTESAEDRNGGGGAESQDIREAVFQVSGMWCMSCAWLIEHALSDMRGVEVAEVSFASDLLKVKYCPRFVPPGRIVERVISLGYRAAEYTGQRDEADHERRDLLLRTGVAAFLWLNVMTFSLVVYAGYFERVTASFGRYIPFLLMALATPAVFYCAAPVLRIAWAGARQRVLRMETLLAIGILMAYAYSAAQAFTGGNHVYFDTACAIVTLVLAGKAIERGAKDKAARAITLLYRLMPNKARLMVNGKERFAALEALRPGMVFRVKPGERIPADGVVVEGRSHADESVVTGESAPCPKAPGDAVVCGSINLGGALDIEATHVGADSTLARIVRTVEQAATNRTKVERSVDRVARVFIPAVLAVSLLAFAGWLWRTGRPADALMHAIAVLVIACPCALGIATPLALTAAVAAASRRGILVSDARVPETIRAVDTVVLDKTGTATRGEFALMEQVGDTSRMAELAAVESYSEHPLARALIKAHTWGRRSNLVVCPAPGDGQTTKYDGLPHIGSAHGVCVHTGMGISGWVGATEYFLGNRRLLESLRVPMEMQTDLPGTVVWFGWDRQVKGALAFGDAVRPEAAELCANLRRRGIRTMLLSGDGRAATESVAAAIGADEWKAEATPDEKVEVIRGLQQRGAVVAMIGDGVNDAPSLAQADLGIAPGSGADIAMQAAPLVLMNSSLGAVIDTLDLSQRTFHIVRQNLFWAFVYNTAGITLAVAGVLNPILAAGAMVLSSLSVIGNSRRLG